MLHLLKPIIVSKFNQRRFPYKLNFSITYKCNSHCKTCNIWKIKSKNELNIKEIEDFFKNNQFSWINLVGGELFVRSDIEDVFRIILKTQKKLALFNISTNGFLSDKIFKAVKFFAKYFRGKMATTISVDSYGKKHDDLRGFPGNWERLIKTYKLLSSIKSIDVFFGTTVSKYNLKDITKIFPALKAEIPELSFNQMHLNLAENSEHYYHKTDNQIPKDYKKVIDFYLTGRKIALDPFWFVERNFFKKAKKFIDNQIYPYGHCSAIFENIFIDPYGNVYPCISYNKKLGNLREEGFELDGIIKRNAKLKKNLLKECPHCWTACEAYCSILRNFPL